MGVNSRLVLEYRSSGFNNGQVFIHNGSKAISVYYGPAGHMIYEAIKKFVQDTRTGSGEFYEQRTTSGVQWREKI